ncbi:MAG: hypothetical protein KDM81_11150, partial [Verrucomicrobiae bacterium]|nr:hypothetical protein [Verrucomicrobiae bacterium]
MLVAKRDYLATVRTKGFIVGLVIAPIFMGGSGIAFALLRGHVDTRDRHIAVLDRSGVVATELERAAKQRNDEVVFDQDKHEKVQPAYVIEAIPPVADDPDAQRLELSDRVRAGDLHGFVDVGPEVLHPGTNAATSYLRYYARNAAFDDLRNWLNNTVNNHLRRSRLTGAGLDEAQADQVFRWISLDPMHLVSQEAGTGEVKQGGRQSEAEAILPPLVLLMLMFLMLMMGA